MTDQSTNLLPWQTVESGFWTIPPAWKNQPAAVVAGGPSLRAQDLSLLNGYHVVVANDAYRLFPNADLCMFLDKHWHDWHEAALHPAWDGRLVTRELYKLTDCRRLKCSGRERFDDRPWCFRSGNNSGYSALHVAVHLGANPIFLLGCDMTRVKVKSSQAYLRYLEQLGLESREGDSHWHGGHPKGQTTDAAFQKMTTLFNELAALLAIKGVTVINISAVSKITGFPTMTLEEAVQRWPARESVFVDSATDAVL